MDEVLAEITRQVDSGMHKAVEAAAKIEAEQAVRSHPYTDRIGTLTASIEAQRASGSFMHRNLYCEVTASAPYAGYVAAKPQFEYLESAFTAAQSSIESAMAQALQSELR